MMVLEAGPSWAARSLSGIPVVIDGDTLGFGERRVRLFGIDAPESLQTCTMLGEAVPIGIWAVETLQRLIGRDTVTCFAVAPSRGAEMVARCHTTAVPSLGGALVESGFAWDFKSRSHGIYADAEAKARAGRLGVWAGVEPCLPPWDWRRRRHLPPVRGDRQHAPTP